MASGMVGSYMLASSRKSAFHERCVPTKDKPDQPSGQPPSKNLSEAEYRKCDNVTQDTIWKQSVDTEKRCLKAWEENWGFLTEFDEKGNQKPPKELPEEVTVYGSNVPITNAGNYGSRTQTDLGMLMQNLEHKFYSGSRRKKLSGDMVCY